MIKIDYTEPFSKDTEDTIMKLIKDNKLLSFDSKLDRYFEMKNFENQITVLGGSIGFIVMLLAISNYLNMMSASIQNRSKEFAVLESVCYAVLSIMIAIIIGIPASYFVFENLNIYRIPFSFPIVNNVILFLFIIVLCILSTVFILRKSKDISIIELLRQDEM